MKNKILERFHQIYNVYIYLVNKIREPNKKIQIIFRRIRKTIVGLAIFYSILGLIIGDDGALFILILWFIHSVLFKEGQNE